MRRLFLPLPVLATGLLIAGCGGGGDGKTALDNALGYLPQDAPFAASIDTDLGGSQYKTAAGLVAKFPFGQRALDSLKNELQGSNVDFDKDVKPLLGNPFVVGAPDAKSFIGDHNVFVGAIETKDGDKLKQLVDKQNAKQVGEKNGAKIYEDGGDTFAVKGEVLVVADTRATLESALDQREADDRLEESKFDEGLKGLPENAVLRVYSDIQGLLAADPSTEQARKVKWVGALRSFGLTASTKPDGVAIDFNLATDAGGLSDADVPLATGSASPDAIDAPGELSVGVRDATQVYKFGLQAARAVDPEGTGQFEAGRAAIEKQLAIDFDRDVLGQLTRNVSVNVAVDGTFAVKAQVKDPVGAKRTVAKIARVIPRIARSSGATLGSAKRGPFYAIAAPGGPTVVFGVVGEDLLVSNNGRRADALVRQQPAPISGAQGSVAVTGDTRQIVAAALRKVGLTEAIGGALFTGPLGKLTGSLNSSTSGIRGSLAQQVK